MREWAYNQAAAKLIEVDEDERFSLSPEAAAVLATPDHPAFGMGMFHRLPELMQSLVLVRDSFATGLGYDYDSHGVEGAVGIERSFEPWSNRFLLPTVLPALDGVVDRLKPASRLADIGCGAGSAVLLMAAAFPKSTFAGYDISRHALIGQSRSRRPRESPMRRSPTLATLRCRLTIPSSGDDVRLPPRHDAPAADDGVDPLGPCRGRHMAARRHQGPRHLRAECRARTRWRR